MVFQLSHHNLVKRVTVHARAPTDWACVALMRSVYFMDDKCWTGLWCTVVAVELRRKRQLSLYRHICNITWHILCVYCFGKPQEAGKLIYIPRCMPLCPTVWSCIHIVSQHSDIRPTILCLKRITTLRQVRAPGFEKHVHIGPKDEWGHACFMTSTLVSII